MAYTKKTWTARQGTGLNKFSIDGAAPVPLVNIPDNVTQSGDAFSAENMNDLENRIDSSFKNGILMPNFYFCDSQEKFEALISTTDWLGYETVYFDGKEIGATGFIYPLTNSSGITIPQTVKTIKGFNSAKIAFQNVAVGLGYATLPASNDYSITDLQVTLSITQAQTIVSTFTRCRNLTNCISYLELKPLTTRNTFYQVLGVYDCRSLINCTSTSQGTIDTLGQLYVYGFRACSKLINCGSHATARGDPSRTLESAGFNYCDNLINCEGRGVIAGMGTSSFGYTFET
jgi:hypothetical protein